MEGRKGVKIFPINIKHQTTVLTRGKGEKKKREETRGETRRILQAIHCHPSTVATITVYMIRTDAIEKQEGLWRI